jgi:hypothetical protein
MSATQLTFDRLSYIDRLTAAGIDEKQARAQADALDAALRETIATKGDIERLEAKMETMNANLKVDILRWLIITQLALAGFVFAEAKFVK